MEKISQKQRKINEELFGDNSVSSKPVKKDKDKSVFIYLFHNKKAIKQEYEIGHYTQYDLARKYGVAQSTIHLFIKKYNYNLPIKKIHVAKISGYSNRELIKYYRKYRSFSKVSKVLNIPETSLWNRLNHAYKKIKVNKYRSPSFQRKSHIHFEKNLDYYYNIIYRKKGYNIMQLSRMVHMNHTTISNIFKKHHLKLRPAVNEKPHKNNLILEISHIISSYKHQITALKAKNRKCQATNNYLKKSIKLLKKQSRPNSSTINQQLKDIIRQSK